MKKRIIVIIALAVALCLVFLGFWYINNRDRITVNQDASSQKTNSDDAEMVIADLYTLYDDVNPSPTPLSCIVIPTSVIRIADDLEVTLDIESAREIEAFLLTRDYSGQFCKCMPEYEFENSRGSYSLNLSECYARNGEGQAKLESHQVNRIKEILAKNFQ